MNLCDDHWARLRTAIDQRGLSSLVADSGAVAHARVAARLANIAAGVAVDEKRTFDPLMNASIALMSNCVSAAPPGLALQMFCVPEGADKPPCPLCFMNEGRYNAAQRAKLEDSPEGQFANADDKGHFDQWLEKAADEQREQAVELGLLASS